MSQGRSNLKLIHFFLLLGTLIMVFPFFWMISTAFKSEIEVLQVPPLVLPGIKHYLMQQNEFGQEEEIQVEIISKNEAFNRSRINPAEQTLKVRVLFGKEKGEEKNVLISDLRDRTFLWGNFSKAWNLQPFNMYFLNSFIVALTVTIFQLLSSSLCAYAFAFMRFPYKETIFMVLLGTMMIPQQALLIPNFVILANLEWVNTYKALIIPWLASVFGIFFLRQFFRQLPKELYEAAIIDGCSRFGFFWRILLPLSIPPLTTIGIFTFLGSWNSFLWPLMVTNDETLRVIEVGLSYFNQAEGTQYELLMAASTFCVMPLVIVYFFLQKQFIASVASTGMKD
ncbi:carbohydrate ABC transporter permease [Candidatus Riflebacteria bacterium]